MYHFYNVLSICCDTIGLSNLILGGFHMGRRYDATVAEQIAMPRKMFGEYKGDYVVTEGVDTRHVTVKSTDGYQVPVRIYKRTNAGQELPMLVYYHGGGGHPPGPGGGRRHGGNAGPHIPCGKHCRGAHGILSRCQPRKVPQEQAPQKNGGRYVPDDGGDGGRRHWKYAGRRVFAGL